MGRRIEVVAHNPEWAEAYERESTELKRVFAGAIASIHHVGSTAVHGLVSKPVIDILVVLEAGTDVSQYDGGVSALGYRVRGECLDAGGTPGRYYYSKPVSGTRTHHLHVCHEGHFQVAELIRFPQYLAEHPEVAAEYGRVKTAAARQHGDDNSRYMAQKQAWIRATIRRALDYYGDPDRRRDDEV